MKKILFFLFLSVMMASCTSRNVTNAPSDIEKPVENRTFFDKINAEQNFQQVKINSKINVETGSYLPTLDATIYIEKDKKVWMNITALLLNIARGMATEDGIQGYEKWNKTYIESDFSYLNKLLNVNFINYKALQNLLTGKAFLPIKSNEYIVTRNTSGYTLQSKESQSVTVDGKTEKYDVKMEYSSDFNLSSVFINQIGKKPNQLEVDYNNWTSAGNDAFPKNVKIIIKGEKTGQIFIENTKFGFDTMQTPYSVPSNYKKTEIK